MLGFLRPLSPNDPSVLPATLLGFLELGFAFNPRKMEHNPEGPQERPTIAKQKLIAKLKQRYLLLKTALVVEMPEGMAKPELLDEVARMADLRIWTCFSFGLGVWFWVWF